MRVALFRSFLLFFIASTILETTKPNRNSNIHIQSTTTLITDLEEFEKDQDWETMYIALCLVESELNPKAINPKTGASGIAQLMPIYVEDANRISKAEKYTLDDRFDEVKTREMFEIIQNQYNKTRDIHKAIKIHNPRAGKWYYDRVMKAFEDIKSS